MNEVKRRGGSFLSAFGKRRSGAGGSSSSSTSSKSTTNSTTESLNKSYKKKAGYTEKQLQKYYEGSQDGSKDGKKSKKKKNTAQNVNIMLLLVNEELKRNEVLLVELAAKDILHHTVADLIKQIQVSATDRVLRNQSYSNICLDTGALLDNNMPIMNYFYPNNVYHVAIAIPYGKNPSQFVRLSLPILNDEKLKGMIGKSSIHGPELLSDLSQDSYLKGIPEVGHDEIEEQDDDTYKEDQRSSSLKNKMPTIAEDKALSNKALPEAVTVPVNKSFASVKTDLSSITEQNCDDSKTHRKNDGMNLNENCDSNNLPQVEPNLIIDCFESNKVLEQPRNSTSCEIEKKDAIDTKVQENIDNDSKIDAKLVMAAPVLTEEKKGELEGSSKERSDNIQMNVQLEEQNKQLCSDSKEEIREDVVDNFTVPTISDDNKVSPEEYTKTALALKSTEKTLLDEVVVELNSNEVSASVPNEEEKYAKSDKTIFQIILVLLKEGIMRYELLEFHIIDDKNSTIEELIANIPRCSKDNLLRKVKYKCLCSAQNGVEINSASSVCEVFEQNNCVSNIFCTIAVPKGMTIEQCVTIVRPLFSDSTALSLIFDSIDTQFIYEKDFDVADAQAISVSEISEVVDDVNHPHLLQVKDNGQYNTGVEDDTLNSIDILGLLIFDISYMTFQEIISHDPRRRSRAMFVVSLFFYIIYFNKHCILDACWSEL